MCRRFLFHSAKCASSFRETRLRFSDSPKPVLQWFTPPSPTTTSATADASVVSLKPGVFPSENVLRRLNKPYQRDKLALRITELEFLMKASVEVPQHLSDDQWLRYYGLHSLEDRCDLIRQLWLDEEKTRRSRVVQDERRPRFLKMLEQQAIDYAAGQMVYKRNYHVLWELFGSHFRKIIDGCYGSRLLAADRCDEQMPQLIVDMRFLNRLSPRDQAMYVGQMQSLHDRNWSSRRPFRISVANLLVNDQLSRLMKERWHFRCGPSPPSIPDRKSRDYGEIDAADLDAKHCNDTFMFDEMGTLIDANETTNDNGTMSFQPHPMIPTLSTRSIQSLLPRDVDPDSIAYISEQAVRYLEAPLTRYSAIVLCAGSYRNIYHSSLAAAVTDNLKAYRFPFEKHVEFSPTALSRVFAFATSASILRDVWLSGGDWKAAFVANLDAQLLRSPSLDEKELDEIRKSRERYVENVTRKRERIIQIVRESMQPLLHRQMQLTPDSQSS